jgi:hypothetical protein
MIFDSHFTDLLIAGDCHVLLQEMLDTVRLQVQLCGKLQGLVGYLQQLLTPTKLPTPQASTDYVIEVLHL